MKAAKRTMDVMAAALGLMICAPIMLLMACSCGCRAGAVSGTRGAHGGVRAEQVPIDARTPSSAVWAQPGDPHPRHSGI